MRPQSIRMYCVFFLTLFSLLQAQTSRNYYIYHGQQITLKTAKDRISVKFNPLPAGENIDNMLGAILGSDFERSHLLYKNSFSQIFLTREISSAELTAKINLLNNSSEIICAAPVYEYGKITLAVADEFIVRFGNAASRPDIATLNQRYQATILEEIAPSTFLLSINKGSGLNGLDAANQYSESDLVDWAQPNFVYPDWELLDASVNDPYWSDQWAHHNNGQSVATGAGDGFPATVNGYADADMDIDLAWDALIAAGKNAGGSSDILVGMLDSGIDLQHPDLAGNLYSNGADFSGDGSTDDIQGHGTATSGIVAAVGNNGQGVAGIAYQSKILPVKFYSLYGSASDADIAQAIDYAWQQGADVLNNSWGGSTPNQAVTDAIHRAKTQGRNGLGCVIFFSSGNEGHGTVNYPAYLSDVIAVGASNMFDEKKNSGSQDYIRKWAGNYGETLDLVAPTTVYTTDIVGSGGFISGDYNDHFSGTSAACPNAAGVGALVLAANPNLTSDEVRNIMERTADKIERYPYNTDGWNKHVGYGRVNAANAVRAALGADSQPPVISHTVVQSTSDRSARVLSGVITDDSGIAGSANQPKLYFRRIIGGTVFDWESVTDIDGPNGSTYEFTIPAQGWGTQIQYYIAAMDNSANNNMTTYPFGGSGISPSGNTPPPQLLTYHVGEFHTQTYSSSNVPVTWNDANKFYTSTLTIPDHRQIVDINTTVDITGNIQDFVMDLEAPDSRGSGFTQMNGAVGDAYSNTTFDDEAATAITDGNNPYSGAYQPDNGLFVFDGGDAAGTWTLRVYDNVYYNNGGTINNWSMNVTYMLPAYAPLVSDIPDQSIDEGHNFLEVDLDNYVTDADNSPAEISWTSSGNSELVVNIDNSTHIATIAAPDSNWNGSETITFTATDPGGLYDNDSAVFTVNPVNDAPVVSDIPDQTIDEGGQFDQIALDNYVSDVDDPVTAMSWSVTGNSELIISTDTDTRIVTIATPNANWSGVETITFTATDPGGLSGSDASIFTVTAVNDTPVVSPIPGQSISEGNSFAAISLDDYVTDEDNTPDQMIWTTAGSNQILVSIDPSNRIATLTLPGIDWNGSETIAFIATDPGGLSDSSAAVFTVTAVNDTPQVSDIPDQSIPEGGNFQPISLDDYVSDVDNEKSSLTWNASTSVYFDIQIDPLTRIATAAPLDSEWNGAENIRFTATDPGGLSDSDTALFAVTAVNDTPLVSDIPDQTISQGGTFAEIQLDSYVSDMDNADSEIVWSSSGGNHLTVNIDENRVATISPENPTWSGSETISFTASDPGNLSGSDTARFTITAVNQPPVVSDIPDQTISEGENFQTIKLDDFVSDGDNADSLISWRSGGNTQLSVNIDHNRVATVTAPNPDWNGSETITFTASDPTGLTNSDAAVFSITAVNDTPVVGNIPDQIIPEDGHFAQIMLDNYVSDVDNSDSELKWTARGNIQLSVTISSGSIATISVPDSEWYGREEIIFTAQDPDGLSDSDSALFAISAINDTPVISQIPPQIILEGGAFMPIALDDYVVDPDNADSSLAWTIAGHQKLRWVLDGNRIATISAPDSNWFGMDTLAFQVMDPDSAGDSCLTVFTVIPVNDPPLFNGLPDSLSLRQDSLLSLMIWDYVQDNETPSNLLQYQFWSTRDSLKLDFSNSTGMLNVSATKNPSGTAILHVVARDDSNAAATDSIIIRISPATGIDGGIADMPAHDFFLMQNYPNPFNPVTTIQYGVPHSGQVSIRIYNILGEQVAILVDRRMEAGRHTVIFDARALPSGLYFYHMNSGNYSRVMKMLLMK